MDITGIITTVSVIIAVSNAIGMVWMYRRYLQITRNAIMALRTTEDGLVEILDLLPPALTGKR